MQHFIPSDSAAPLRVLAEAFPLLPPSVARAAIELHTRPADVIVDPFCIGTSVIEAGLALDRKVIAASFNPINRLAIEATLWPGDARAALTHLADAPKGPQRLRARVLDLYATRCPTCQRDAIALRFEWDRERNLPIEKHVNCAACGENIGPTDAADLELAAHFKPRGLPFWTLHSRVIDPNHEAADRVDEVLEAYTPRAQNALGDIVLKFESLPEADRAALRPALLAMFDAAVSLHAPNDTHHALGLKPPPRFIEKNVWLELEQHASRQPAGSPSLQRVSTIGELFESPASAMYLLTASSRDLAKQLPPQSIALLIAHPPQPRPGFWSLSAAWTAWLWGRAAAEPLLPLLSHKRTNWDWQWRAIGAGLKALKPALRNTARSVMAFAYDEAMLESVVLAAGTAGQTLEHIVCDPFDGVRGTWRSSSVETPATSDEAEVRSAIRRGTRDAAARLLRDRAEPTAWPILQAGLYAALGCTDVLESTAHLPEAEHLLRESVHDGLSGCVELAEHHWWLVENPIDSAPLSDQVEWAVRELLQSRAAWRSDDLLREVYARFPDQLTPDRALVATTISSYTVEVGPHQIGLRPEDEADARRAELIEAETLLLTIGAQLGFETETRREGRAVIWQQADRAAYTFTLNATAEIAPLLHAGASTGVLVLPGGRATLLQHKLARDPRLRQTPWQVLKFSSLRRAAQQPDLTPATFELAFGLNPPIERAGVQFALW